MAYKIFSFSLIVTKVVRWNIYNKEQVSNPL